MCFTVVLVAFAIWIAVLGCCGFGFPFWVGWVWVAGFGVVIVVFFGSGCVVLIVLIGFFLYFDFIW